jgi:dihydroorotate dehydrogenase
MFATRTQSQLYKHIAKPILFQFDPEQIHDIMINIGSFLGEHKSTRRLTRVLFDYQHPALEQTIDGITFPNPIGLAAGFDKNAQLTQILPHVGFGFIEVGSITADPCPGNPKPRLWRLPEQQSLQVYYGLKNNGSKQLSDELRNQTQPRPIGISIAKTNSPNTVSTQEAIEDYVTTYKRFKDIGDYDTINISCPNTYGGEPFLDTERLTRLLSAINEIRGNKPIYLKLSPNLSLKQLDILATVASNQNIHGLICSNLNKNHNHGKGGLSGKAVSKEALAHLHHITKNFPHLTRISCGGVFTPEDAYERLNAGAHLIQLITGMIYQGPQIIGEINRGIAEKLKQQKQTSINGWIK